MIRATVELDDPAVPGRPSAFWGPAAVAWLGVLLAIHTGVWLLHGTGMGSYFSSLIWLPVWGSTSTASLGALVWFLRHVGSRGLRKRAAEMQKGFLVLGLTAVDVHTMDASRTFGYRDLQVGHDNGWWHVELPGVTLTFPDEAAEAWQRKWLARRPHPSSTLPA